MAQDTIIVNDSGAQMAFTDTGVPSQSPYITIVAIHGLCFAAPIFKRVQDVAIKKGVRFIALNRRGYLGTAPYNEEELNVLRNGTKEQKDAWHRDRGHEVGMFIHKLIDKENLPPISADRKTGGVVLLGWSAGGSLANATIAYVDTLPFEVRTRLGLYIRSLIIQDSPAHMFGFPTRPQHYTPFMDQRIRPEDRFTAFGSWVSAYFQHGDISLQNPDVLSWVEPSTVHPATVDNMTVEEQKEIIYTGKGVHDEIPYLQDSLQQFGYAYRKAFLDDGIRTLFPGLKASLLVGEMSPAFAISSYWMLENARKETGKPFNIRLISDSNHFLHWDDPERALKTYLECS